ncbi:hypothetical protein GCM10011519_20110 [Marmoricola endophyticus]|uniref:Uncharacterized protein n=1 Tax=Marmoricola endophyticus TaxID=2040280 RepID=A0A917BHY3_9ACTN|nr:hypothetical protein GCM10011519_20110 [Marmoricola endophyticus]
MSGPLADVLEPSPLKASYAAAPPTPAAPPRTSAPASTAAVRERPVRRGCCGAGAGGIGAYAVVCPEDAAGAGPVDEPVLIAWVSSCPGVLDRSPEGCWSSFGKGVHWLLMATSLSLSPEIGL